MLGVYTKANGAQREKERCLSKLSRREPGEQLYNEVRGLSSLRSNEPQSQDRLNRCNKYTGQAVGHDGSSQSYNGSSSADSALVATAPVRGENEPRWAR